MKDKMKIISIFIIFLFISSCDSIDGNILTFYEENLAPQQMIVYSDNSLVFRLVERLNNTCNVPSLTYRILYPNGTHNLITVYDHQIPSFNFCLNNYRDQTQDLVLNDQLILLPTVPNYILVLYSKHTDEKNTTLTFGMIIDWNGAIKR
jgi:hypothetical protein